jgi:hypothetical protein
MSACSGDCLIVAIDYYDGEAEGFARLGNHYSYFVRLKDDGDGDTKFNQYASATVDQLLFDQIADLAGAVPPPSGVFVYSGSCDALNRKLDEVIPDLRRRLTEGSLRSQGNSYLESIRR